MEKIISRYENFVMFFIREHALEWLFVVEGIIGTFAVGLVTIISKIVTIMVGKPEMLELCLAWAVVYLTTEHLVVMFCTDDQEDEIEDK